MTIDPKIIFSEKNFHPRTITGTYRLSKGLIDVIALITSTKTKKEPFPASISLENNGILLFGKTGRGIDPRCNHENVIYGPIGRLVNGDFLGKPYRAIYLQTFEEPKHPGEKSSPDLKDLFKEYII